jgi:hypothetical protein
MAEALQELQATYEESPGFMAVVHDGASPIIVVDRALLPQWHAQMAPRGVRVAPSCVDARLVDAVLAALPKIDSTGGASSTGYDAIRDAIIVRGVKADDLVAAIRQFTPELGDAAEQAIAAGTLRVDSRPLPGQRLGQ